MKSRRFKAEAQEEESGTALLGFEDPDNTQCSQLPEWAEGEPQQSPQQQSRWTPESTRLMLQLRFERQQEFQQRLKQKKELWSEIATEMRRQGQADNTICAEVCDLKYRNMLQTYKKNRLKEDSGMQSLIVWEYYDLFKEALKSAEEAEAQDGQDHVVPSLLCESVCEAGNEEEGEGVPSVTDVEMLNKRNGELSRNSNNNANDENSLLIEELTKPITTTRKRSRASTRNSTLTVEIPPPLKPQPSAVTATDDVFADEHTTKSAKTNIKTDEAQLHTTSHNASNNSINPPSCKRVHLMPAQIESTNEVHEPIVPNAVRNEPVFVTATTPMPSVVAMPQPDGQGLTPAWLTTSELREYQAFGESIGLQLANVRESHMRVLLQFKIQELLYMAKTGRLTENLLPRGAH